MAVSVPVLASVSPVSSTLSVSLPPWPLIARLAAIALTLPPVAGARLPTLTRSAPRPPFTVVAALIDRTFTTSASAPVSIVVAAPVEKTLTVSVPAFVFTVVVPATVSSVTASAPPFVFSSVEPACVLFTVNVSSPLPRPILRASSVP